MSTPFAKEIDLCRAFLSSIPDSWAAYPETGGFDILLVRKVDGFQVGIEAKLRLNAKVISQAAEDTSEWRVAAENPDCRAVLIPEGVSLELAPVCSLIGLTVIRMRHGEQARHHSCQFYPELPDFSEHYWHNRGWHERCPVKRIGLPDWVPDVPAGDSAPVALTHWKVGAIKLVVTLEKRGFLTRGDFAHFKISMSRWTQEKWLVKDGQGGWIAGPFLPDFKRQHPVNFEQIAADFEKWCPPEAATQRGLFASVGDREGEAA